MFTIVMTVLAVVVIFLLGMVGLYFVLQKDNEASDTPPAIYHSGVYSLLRKSPREAILQSKLSNDDVAKILLEKDSLKDDQRQALLNQWNESIENSIREVETGDQNGVQTYGYENLYPETLMQEFLTENTYITREMIYNHPQLLPPFFIGCRAKLVAKQPWQSPKKGGWEPLLPVDGEYKVPEIRQIQL